MHAPIGVIINCSAVLFGGLAGVVAGKLIPERIRNSLTITFGLASIAMGVSLIVDMQTLPAVILSLVLGSILGEAIQFEKRISDGAMIVKKAMGRFVKDQSKLENPDEFMEKFIGILVLFCASGTGIFGAIQEGITGDASILLTKSFLDFFTAILFAASLGILVATISIPQLAIMLALFYSASLIMPLTDPKMIADFSATGGIIMLATGFRICGIKSFPVANMLPALLLAMPISYVWSILAG